MTDKIKEALAKLDAKNDNQWTADGLPKVEVVRIMVGDPKISREDVTNADPEFNRTVLQGKANPPVGGEGTDLDKANDQAGSENREVAVAAQPVLVSADQAGKDLTPKADSPNPGGSKVGGALPGTDRLLGETTVTPPMKADGTLAPVIPTFQQPVIQTAAPGNANDPATGEATEGTQADQDAAEDAADALDGEIKDAEANLQDLYGRLAAARDYVKVEERKLDALYAQRVATSMPTHLKTHQSINGYLQAQLDKRAQAAEAAEANPGSKTRAAPIDESMRNRRRPAPTL